MKNRIEVGRFRRELEAFREELRQAPKGYLVKKGSTFYQVRKERTMGITRKPELIRQLCRKKYLEARIGNLEANFSKSVVDFAVVSPKDLIAGFASAYQSVPLAYFYHPEIERWRNKLFAKNGSYPEQVKYASSPEQYFRSMSERTIAEVLDQYDLPYHYDAVFTLGSKRVSPDFLIKNPFTGETFIWEHFGAFNQEGYANAMNDKLAAYLREGYVPYENLIFTYEGYLRNLRWVKDLVERVIL